MLRELHIENIAVIERADIEPGPGLNVLTGETGAGKSIVIDSLQAVLGSRVSRELVRTGAPKASVSAAFSSERAELWLRERDLESAGRYDAENPDDSGVLIRRRISAEGKSSAWINGENATAAELRELGALLLDIHGQNDGRALLDEANHRAYLDSFGELEGELAAYREKYEAWRETKRELDRLDMNEREREFRLLELERTIQELEGARLSAGEEAALTERRELVRNSEKLTEALDAAYEALYGASPSATELAGEAEGWCRRAADMAAELGEAAGEISSALSELADAAERIRDFRASLDIDEGEYDALETRLAQLRRLEKRYATDEAGLIAELERARGEYDALKNSAERREELALELAKRQKTAYNASKLLSHKRGEAAKRLAGRVQAGLRELSMPGVSFETVLEPLEGEPGFDETGCDSVRFLMSANAGEKPGRISRIASGGELARIMLVLKDALTERSGPDTLVFDEIDEGVSGIAAQRVAEKLAHISRRKQVICVTHLPQIAAMADTHLHVEKRVERGRTYTAVVPLDRAGRIRELARLHGGDNITDTTLKSAEEQLDAASEFKREER
ncbi:MAG TPA: DNA repair protein RecN [Candidatus Scatomorpha merdipullorum]|uniref:DNA repair protein RecN n=1 Tax=Candidatus Scatomorpha merdipullorum TaxID=2840927 RepID=A0A9D1FEQ8_9FIRM|nr:DNA repair protein RecN [Candidatus Scatomorpha merdipullorum]